MKYDDAVKHHAAWVRAVERQRLLHLSKRFKHHPLHLYSLSMRESTLRNTLDSLGKGPVSRSSLHKTSPTSNLPNFQYLRHRWKKPRLIRQRGQQFYHLNANSPVRVIEGGRFQSPGQSVYGYGHTVVTITTPGGTQDKLHPLEKPSLRKSLSFEEAEQLPFENQISEVSLSYDNLVRPAGNENRRKSNKQVQGGHSADDLFEQQFEDFKNQIFEHGLATKDDLDKFLSDQRSFRYEHTHLIASHFGKLKTREGQTLSPTDKESTFVGTEHLNSEMMLFEKFVDFLLYLNHKKHGCLVREKTVDYSCKVLFARGTRIPVGVQLKIVDKRTGIEFTQTWDDPYRVVEKPSLQTYVELLKSLKQGLNRQFKV